MSKSSFAQGQLKSLIERIERLEELKKSIAADIAEVKAEAKANGFDVKIINAVLRLRKKEASERAEEEALFDVYLAALGMTPIEQAIEDTEEAGLPASVGKITACVTSDDTLLASSVPNLQVGHNPQPATEGAATPGSPSPAPSDPIAENELPDIPQFLDRRKPTAAQLMGAG